jgi:prevent-host-death family protein
MTRKKSTSMPAGEFKAKCLKVMETVYATGEEVIITKHGKPVARLAPVAYATRPLFGRAAEMVLDVGDIVSPIDIDLKLERGWGAGKRRKRA